MAFISFYFLFSNLFCFINIFPTLRISLETFPIFNLFTFSTLYFVCASSYASSCNNYRGITVLNTAYKIFSLILQDRLVPHVEEIVGNYQRGFRNGKSTTDQIFAIRQILEKMAEYSHNTCHLFIDFTNAYDSIGRLIEAKELRRSQSLSKPY